MTTETKKHVSPAPRTSARYCPDCGFKIRGSKHEDGQHHRAGKDGKYAMPRGF